jgi:galactokinase
VAGVAAFAPGRANLIGEHTDYNGGLALPFAIEQGVTVHIGEGPGGGRVSVTARDLDERDEFDVSAGGPERTDGWRAYVRGAVAVSGRAAGAAIDISSTLARGSGLSSSAALTVALLRALEPDRETLALAKLAQQVENDWAGADTGLLDQLAVLLGEPGRAVRIDFRTLSWQTVPLDLGDWRLALLDSGATHDHATGGYNERRAECRAAAARLGLETLSDATLEAAAGLPDPLARRARHVLEENQRVDRTVAALRARDLAAVGDLLDASHASLRDLYDASVPAVEDTVRRAKGAGAAGARMMGGGFGGVVLGLFPPDATPPGDALDVRPSTGARVLRRERVRRASA